MGAAELPEDMPDMVKNNINGAEQKVWVSCQGENPADKEGMAEFEYFPADAGFPAQVLVLGSLQGLARVVGKALDGQVISTLLDELNNGVIEGILVLLKPSGQVVGHGG